MTLIKPKLFALGVSAVTIVALWLPVAAEAGRWTP